MKQFPWLVEALLFSAFGAFLLTGVPGCSTGPPPSPAAAAAKTLTFQVSVNPSGGITTQFTTSQGNTYLGIYLIAINTLNTSLVGGQAYVTTNSDTWTDYLELSSTGWIRNHRIAAASSQQPQQWAGSQAITPGSISGSTLTIALSLPDQYLGSASLFNASVITYLSTPSNPCDPSSDSNVTGCNSISALGPSLSTTHSIENLSFNASVSKNNTLSDGSPGDWLTVPQFTDLTSTNYQNFDVNSLAIIEN